MIEVISTAAVPSSFMRPRPQAPLQPISPAFHTWLEAEARKYREPMGLG
jgi:hypothetical protein